jgi:hypothetical protein
MRVLVSAVLFCAALAAEPAATVSGAVGRRLPRIELRPLSGPRVVLPDSNLGHGTIAVFAFRRQDQSEVDTWLQYLWQAEAVGCRFYEVPMLGPKIPGLLQRVIVAGMQGSLPRTLRPHVAPYFGDVDGYAQALRVEDRNTILLVVVGPDGGVILHVPGAADPEAGRGVLDACRAMSAGPAR